MLSQHTRAACVREVQSSIKDSVKQLVEDKIAALGVGSEFRITEKEIVAPRFESQMVFKGLKNHTASSIKSLEGYNRCLVEEAQSISQRSLDILIPTIRSEDSQFLFLWNLVSPKDPVDKLFEENKNHPDFACIHVTYKDNPWFPDVLRRDMERDRARDPEKYSHIWLGHYQSRSESQVFKNFRIGEFDVPPGARPHYGGDWGFAIDPNVLVRGWIVGRTLYIDEEAYAVGCPTDKIPFLFGGCEDEELKRLNTQAWAAMTAEEKRDWHGIEGARLWPITSDSARPETIDYMQRHGFPHVQAARKGPGSIEDGVEFLKSFDIVINPRCKHTVDEFTYYSYKVDKLTNEVLPVLKDTKNNVIDSCRYMAEQVRVFDGGTVYATPEPDIVIPTCKVPEAWPRIWALDIDGAKASALWAAHDRESDVLWVYGEFVAQRHELALVADAIRTRGGWIPGLFDHMDRGRDKIEGARIIDALLDLRLDVFTVHCPAEAAVPEVTRRLTTKRIKVFDTCPLWLAQYRAYRRNKDGNIVDESDGLMRAMDLLAMEGPSIAGFDEKTVQDAKDDWDAGTRSSVTGY